MSDSIEERLYRIEHHLGFSSNLSPWERSAGRYRAELDRNKDTALTELDEVTHQVVDDVRRALCVPPNAECPNSVHVDIESEVAERLSMRKSFRQAVKLKDEQTNPFAERAAAQRREAGKDHE